MGSLDESALSLLKNIVVSGDNYEKAWSAILKEHNNKRKLAVSYLEQLLFFEPHKGKATVESLKRFLTVVSESIGQFQQLGIENSTEFILFMLAARCLDSETRRAFEVAHVGVQFSSSDQLTTSVRNKMESLTNASSLPMAPRNTEKTSQTAANKSNHKLKPGTSPSTFTSLIAQSPSNSYQSKSSNQPTKGHAKSSNRNNPAPMKCFICGSPHILKEYSKFKTASPAGRLQLLQNWSGCRNCLHPGHRTKQCVSHWKCRTCSGSYHTLLNLPAQQQAETGQKEDTQVGTSGVIPQGSVPPSSSALTSLAHQSRNVQLGTAVAQIKDSKGNLQSIRLVLDSGSQFSFIRQDLVESLGLSPSGMQHHVRGIANTPIKLSNGEVHCVLTPMGKPSLPLTINAIVVPEITQYLPRTPLPANLINKYLGFNLADPEFGKPGPIDILLGADWFMDVIVDNPIIVNKNEPRILNTIFGHVVIGQYQDIPESKDVQSLMAVEHIDQILKRFWEIEEVDHPTYPSPEEQKCEDHFRAHHFRLLDGRYVVALPFKEDHMVNFPNSKHQALSRLYNLEAKLTKDPDLNSHYKVFMQEYIELGHMSPASSQADNFIPHHPVIKRSGSAISKIRVVFDASARSSIGSLNDCLCIGPKLQRDISDILLNFRRHEVAFTADIVKMYRQVLIRKEDRRFQHILWRSSPDEEVKDYELNTITYGMACSPYLALRVIQQLVNDEGKQFPLAAAALLNDIYVDDIVTGASSLSEANMLKQQLIQLLAKGGFELSKWASHPSQLLSAHDEGLLNDISLGPKDDYSVKILGLRWEPCSDTLSYDVQPPPKIVTKRSVLSTIARIFDPLGYLAPVVFYAKILLPQTWLSGVGWDDHLPAHITTSWLTLVQDLANINKIKIPRFIGPTSQEEHLLIGFCDASEKGYCGALYLRCRGDKGTHCVLLKAKIKLAPTKRITIPRLELLGALLLARLIKSVQSFASLIGIRNVYLFCDSSVVLGWLRTTSNLLKVFVAHRVTEILENTTREWWRHISTAENPSDCGSRGLLPSQLINHPLWWQGPSWILEPVSHGQPLLSTYLLRICLN